MTTYNEAVEQTITAGEQIHQIVNGTATTEVTVEDGSKVPSIRKALLDNFYFKDPIAWQVGQTEKVFNQLRQFTDGSWWYAPSATASNPISMGSTPVGDSLWKIYDFDAIKKLTPQLREALRRSYAEAGYNLVEGSFEAGGTLVNSNDVLLHEASGKAFSGPAGKVSAGTNPTLPSSGYVSRTDVLLRADLAGNSGSGLVGFKRNAVDSVIRTAFDKHSDYFHVKDFGALCDGVTSDSDAVNAAILAAHTIGVGEVHFSGVMAISTPIYARSGVTLVGDGQKTSVIKTLPYFTGNIYETFDFATVQAAQLTNASNGCPSCYGIENCTIDGYNFSGAPTASTGYGVRLYGSQLRLNNLLIGRCANIGLYTELSTVADGSSFNAITDTKFSKIQNIEVLECGYEGFVFFGPTDQYLDNIFVGWPGGSRFDDYDTTGPKTSLLFPGEQIHGVRIMRTAEVGFLHSYDNNYGYAVYISRKAGDPVVRFRANYLMGENGYGNVFIGANVRYAISLLETHNNTRGPTTGGAYSGDAGANPHFYNISTLGGSVSKLDIWRDGDENGSTGVLLKGLSHDINANIYAYSGTFTGGGDGFNNKASASNLKANIISKAGVDTLSIGYIEDSTALDNNLDVYASFCDVNISLLGAAGADTGSFYKLKAKSAGTTNISNLARLAGIPYSQAVIMTDDGVYKRRNKALLSLAVNFSVTGLQTLSIPYGNFLVRDPLETEVRLEVSYDTGTLPGVARLAVINIDTVNKEIDFMVEFTGGAAGTGKINAFI